MRPRLAAGWEIVHVTDRCVELRKPSVEYRRLTGRDGYVRVRAEPGMDRQAMLAKAEQIAARNDEELAKRLVKQIAPSTRALVEYGNQQRRMAQACATGQESNVIGVKR